MTALILGAIKLFDNWDNKKSWQFLFGLLLIFIGISRFVTAQKNKQ